MLQILSPDFSAINNDDIFLSANDHNPTFGEILNQSRGENVEVQLDAANNSPPTTVTGVIIGMEVRSVTPKDALVSANKEMLNLHTTSRMKSHRPRPRMAAKRMAKTRFSPLCNPAFRALYQEADAFVPPAEELDIPMNELRDLLGWFDFYFALPGTDVPFAHNIIEAMSAGCVPFLQEGYANLFQPPLIDGVQAVTFKDLNDLEIRLRYLQGVSLQTTASMRENVRQYYQNYLTPRGVVARIEHGDYEKLYLQAVESGSGQHGHRRVGLYHRLDRRHLDEEFDEHN